MRGLILWSGILIVSSVFTQEISYQEVNTVKTEGSELVFLENAEKYRPSISTAAEVFPELTGINIEIKRKNIGTMMAARPKSDFLFTRKDKREYVIIISDRKEMNADTLLKNMSMKAQIGVAGHELSHILSYTEKNNLQMLWFGVVYVFNKKEIEAETDLIAIKKGFGENLVDFNHFLHHSPKANKAYLKKKERYYLSASEIEEMLDEI